MSSGKQLKLGLNTQPNTQLVNALTELSLQLLMTQIFPTPSSEALKPAHLLRSPASLTKQVLVELALTQLKTSVKTIPLLSTYKDIITDSVTT